MSKSENVFWCALLTGFGILNIGAAIVFPFTAFSLINLVSGLLNLWVATIAFRDARRA